MATTPTKTVKKNAATTSNDKLNSYASGVPYMEAQTKRVKVTIKTMEDPKLTVVGIIPPEYTLSVKNDFQPLLPTNNAIGELNRATQFIQQAVGPNRFSDISLVPYSPQIWTGAQPLEISELTLYFVAYKDPYTDVHLQLMNLLAMSLPRKGGSARGAMESMGITNTAVPDMGMLKYPPPVEVTIGEILKWDYCFISNISVKEKAPYSPKGYGFTGEAKINIMRREYVFADAFALTASTAAAKTTSSKPNTSGAKKK